MVSVVMRLAEYLAQEGMTQADFARKIGQEQATIARYCTGKRTPQPEVMRKIVQATRGQVQPNDFYDVPARWRSPAPAGSAA